MLSVVIICSVLLLLKTDVTAMGTELVITTNSFRLNYVMNNLSDKYDGEANYAYEDGEEIDFSCNILSSESLNAMRLEYYNAEGNLLFKTKSRNNSEHKFHSVLKSNNNKYYLVCVLRRNDPEKEYLYRTTFYLIERHVDAETVYHAIVLSVNGQNLTVIPINEPNYDDYKFRYIEGELLQVTCRKTDYSMAGTLTFTYYSIDGDSTRIRNIPMVKGSSEISLNVSSLNIFRRKLLSCSINNSDVHKPNARLLFVSDLPENDVRIQGLPRNNILYQYTNDENQWTIEYQYVVNETLDLTCVAKGPVTFEKQHLEWEFNGASFTTTTTSSLRTFTIVSNEKFTKTLDVIDNAKKIRCIFIPNTLSKTVEVILRLKPEANSGENISIKTQSDANISDNQDTAGGYSPLILGSSIGAVLVFLGMSGVACILCKRSRCNRRNNETYGDLTNNKDSIKPHNPDECEDQYDTCYSENQSEIYCEIPANLGNIDPENFCAEVNNSRCKPRIDETKTINALVYDEPYVHLTMRGTINTFESNCCQRLRSRGNFDVYV